MSVPLTDKLLFRHTMLSYDNSGCFTIQAGEATATTSQSTTAVGQKRTLPIQLSLSIAPGTLGANQNIITPPTQNTQGNVDSVTIFTY